MQFYTIPQEEVNFLAMNWYCATCPDSDFTQMLFLNRRTETGSVGIMGDTYIRMDGGKKTIRPDCTEDEIYRLIEKEFDLRLPEG